MQAKSRSADVIVFPELFTTGYTLSHYFIRWSVFGQLPEDSPVDRQQTV